MRLQFKLLPLIRFISTATLNQWRLYLWLVWVGFRLAWWGHKQLPFFFFKKTKTISGSADHCNIRWLSLSCWPKHPPFKPIRFSISAKFRRHWHTLLSLGAQENITDSPFSPLICPAVYWGLKWVESDLQLSAGLLKPGFNAGQDTGNGILSVLVPCRVKIFTSPLQVHQVISMNLTPPHLAYSNSQWKTRQTE